jgi:NADPH2:quinone reductase
MRAIEISQFGAPSVLRVTDRPVPDLLPDQVLIRVAAAGINRPDVLQRQGKYPAPPGVTDIPGLEVAGEIVAGSSSMPGLHVGQRVCALVAGGGYAEYCAASASLCLPVPEGWSLLEAASLPETLFTVWSNIFDRAHIQPGESLLVQGGSSGIGVMAIQLATALGHRVWATAGTDEKARACERLGAIRGINYRTEDFVGVIKQMTQGRGVDVILDMVGGDYVARELDCLAEEGRLVLIALLGGARSEINLTPFLLRRLSLTGSTLRARPLSFKTAIAEQLHHRVWPLLESRAIQPIIHQVFALEQAAQAHALMESSTHIGKIMLSLDTM